MRIVNTHDLRAKVLGSIVFSKKDQEFYFVKDGGQNDRILEVDLARLPEPNKKVKTVDINDESDLSFSFKEAPGFVNEGSYSAYVSLRPRRGYRYGINGSSVQFAFGHRACFERTLLSEGGLDALKGIYPSFDECMFYAFSEDEKLYTPRAFDKHVALVKTEGNKEPFLFVGTKKIGKVTKDKKLFVKNPELFTKVFPDLSKLFDVCEKKRTPLVGDEKDLTFESRKSMNGNLDFMVSLIDEIRDFRIPTDF